MNTPHPQQVDIVLIGGGILGLWTLNCLRKQGYEAILLENQALGSGQTIKAQGIIHSGLKYALQGTLTAEAKALATSPAIWQSCLEGQGDLDLREVKILSPYHYLFSQGGLRAKFNQFLASQALASHSQAIGRHEYPLAFLHKDFKGSVYRISEKVLDVESLLQVLSQPYRKYILKVNDLHFDYAKNDYIQSVNIFCAQADGKKSLSLQAQYYLLTAGAGNEQLLQGMPAAPKMQKRPLHMVLVKSSELSPLYAHWIGTEMKPRLTITSHQAQDNQWVWYLGGQMAEEGITRIPAQQINFAYQELSQLFPWLNFSSAHFASFYIDRAEAATPRHQKPLMPYMHAMNNYLSAWPTKLAFVPQLARDILTFLNKNNIRPPSVRQEDWQKNEEKLANWPKAIVALPPWSNL